MEEVSASRQKHRAESESINDSAVRRKSGSPSQQGHEPPYVSAEASAGLVSHDGAAGPVWAAQTGPPRTPRGARNMMARREAGRSWSHHTGLTTSKTKEEMEQRNKELNHTPSELTLIKGHFM